jgi:hypothetical protein
MRLLPHSRDPLRRKRLLMSAGVPAFLFSSLTSLSLGSLRWPTPTSYVRTSRRPTPRSVMRSATSAASFRRSVRLSNRSEACSWRWRHALSQAGSKFELVEVHKIPSPPEWDASLDEYRRGAEQMLWAHVRFSKFSPSVFKSFLKWWTTFRSVVTAPIWAGSQDDTDLFAHFVRRAGFVPFKEVPCQDGKARRIFIHTI